MTLVVDASVIVAALVDSGPVGTWAETLVATGDLAAPHLMPVEVATVLRRAAAADELPDAVASLAHADLLRLRVGLFAYAPFADRVWELRSAVTAYDACYVALAEHLDAPLATLDARLASAPGPACDFVLHHEP